MTRWRSGQMSGGSWHPPDTWHTWIRGGCLRGAKAYSGEVAFLGNGVLEVAREQVGWWGVGWGWWVVKWGW